MQKQKSILFVVFLAFVNVLNAQNIDSLFVALKNAKHDTVKIKTLMVLAASYRKTKIDSAYLFNQKAVDLAKVNNNSVFIIESLRNFGISAQANSDNKKAINYYNQALEYCKKSRDKKREGLLINDIGVANYFSGEYETASAYFEKAGKLKMQIGDSVGAAQSYNNTGIMYDIAGKPKEALKIYLVALQIYENAKDTNLILGTMSNIGLIYIGQKNYNEAIKIYKKQEELAQKIGSNKAFATALLNQGTALDNLNKSKQAKLVFEKALEVIIKINDNALLANCYTNLSANAEQNNENEKALEFALKAIKIKKENKLGRLAISQIAAGKAYYKKAQYSQSIQLYNEALKNAEKENYVEHIIQTHNGLSQAFSKTKNFEKAYFHLSKFVMYNDSVTNAENGKVIAELEKKFQSEKKEKEIELLNKNNALKDFKLEKASEETKRKNTQITGMLVVGVLLVIFVVFVIKNSLERKKTNKILSAQNEEINKQKNEAQHQRHLVEEKNKEIVDSINYAKRIQTAILPPLPMLKTMLPNSFIFYKPKDIVAGDFYWLEQKDEKIMFAAADCTGHGVPGAMVSVVCNNALNRAVREYGHTNPCEILNKTREIVIQEFEKSADEVKDGMDISLCCIEGKTLSWAGANNPLWIIRNGEIIETKADKQPIGKFINPKPFTTHQFLLQKGDSIYIFTDGFQDQFGGDSGKKYKAAQLKQLLISVQNKTMSEQHDILEQEFSKWKGSIEQIDDVCVFGVKI
ncbi:MAG: tetratricopeptide repeat protein [Bacteroidota bacterium]